MVPIKLSSLILVATLTGCAVQQQPPVDVSLIPNDCANQRLIINYLTQQSQLPRRNFESEQDYERTRSEIRHRIWNMRYVCNPV